MQWYEILIVIACVFIVFGVALGSIIRKKRNKGKGGCGCSCSACAGCAEYRKMLEAEKNSK